MKLLPKAAGNASRPGRLNTRQRLACYLTAAGHPAPVVGCRCALQEEMADVGEPALTPALLRAAVILDQRLEQAKQRVRAGRVCAGCGGGKPGGTGGPIFCRRCQAATPKPVRDALYLLPGGGARFDLMLAAAIEHLHNAKARPARRGGGAGRVRGRKRR